MSQDIILSPSTRLLRCSLLVLPLEVRRQIYKFALAQNEPVCLPQRPVPARSLCEWCKVSLLATSKQIYAEALPLFYQDDTIWIPPVRISSQRLEMPTREACCLIRAVKLALLCHTLELPVMHNGRVHFPLVHDSALVQKRRVGQLVGSLPNLTSLVLRYDSAWTFHHVLIDICAPPRRDCCSMAPLLQ
jgi:hypothetical protein